MSKNSGPGMRILWIPGRKKHNKKGVYTSTGKNVNYNQGHPKKNETWSLGGNRYYHNITKEDLNDESGIIGTSSRLVTTAATSGAILSGNKLEEVSVINKENEENIKEQCLLDENQKKISKMDANSNLEINEIKKEEDIEVVVDDKETENISKVKKIKKKNKKHKKDVENEKEDDKLVKCVYYTLECCECTIS